MRAATALASASTSLFPCDKRQEEADLRDRLDVVVNGEHGKARKLRQKALGRMQDEDLLLIRKVEFFKYFAHGFL